MKDILPKEITIDTDTEIEIASFDYYDGIKVAKQKNLQQTTYFSDVFANTHFIVCCGDVMIRVESNDYPQLNRRKI